MNTARIRQLRQQKNFTLEQLARKTGFSKGYLSRIENSESLPPFPTIQRIAGALDEELTEFIKDKEAGQGSSNLDMVFAADSDWIESVGGYAYRKMVSAGGSKYMMPMLMKVKPGRTESLKNDGEEFVFVVSGSGVLEYEGKRYEMPEKSGAYLDSRIKHVFINNEKETLVLLAVSYDYRRF